MGRMTWRLLNGSAGALAGVLTDRVLHAAWNSVRGTEPPQNPEDPDTSWKEAVAWTLLSSAVSGLVGLVVTRRAAAYYRKSSGELPHGLRR